jgi:hypothetical protein
MQSWYVFLTVFDLATCLQYRIIVDLRNDLHNDTLNSTSWVANINRNSAVVLYVGAGWQGILAELHEHLLHSPSLEE